MIEQVNAQLLKEIECISKTSHHELQFHRNGHSKILNGLNTKLNEKHKSSATHVVRTRRQRNTKLSREKAQEHKKAQRLTKKSKMMTQDVD